MIFYNIWRTISLANLNQGVCKEPGMTLVANFYLDDDGFFGVLCKRYQKSRHVHLIKHSILMSRRYVYSTVQLSVRVNCGVEGRSVHLAYYLSPVLPGTSNPI